MEKFLQLARPLIMRPDLFHASGTVLGYLLKEKSFLAQLARSGTKVSPRTIILCKRVIKC